MNKDKLAITTCSSPHDPSIGAHVGISIRHKCSNIVIKNTTETSQFANKKIALAKLEKELSRYDAFIPLSRFKREMNQILRKFEQKVWRLILVTRAKHTVLIVSQAWDDWFESDPTRDFSPNRGIQYQKPRENLD